MIDLRVVHLLSHFAPSAASSQVLNLSRWLIGSGHSVLVVAEGGERLQECAEDDIPVHEFKSGGPGWIIKGRRKVVRTVADWQPDLIHVHRLVDLSLALAMAEQCRCPVVVSVHGQPDADQVEDLKHHHVSCLLVPRESGRAWLVGRLGCDRDRVALLPYGFDIDKFTPAAEDRPIKTVGAMGRFNETLVDFTTLLDALAILPGEEVDLQALLIGRGKHRQALEAAIAERELGQRVAVTKSPARSAETLAKLDAFVYDVAQDSHPITLLKAMAAGLPVVAAAVGCVPEEVIDEETGLLVPPDDSEALAKALRGLADDPAAAWRMGRAAREHVRQQHGIEVIGELAHEIYRSVIRGSAQAGTESVTTYKRLTERHT